MAAHRFPQVPAAGSLRQWVKTRITSLCKSGAVALVGAWLLSGAVVHAQTSVSGPVPSDARWTLEQSPYLVEGNVVVQNGATLTIDAGVAVYMAPNTGLTVQSGSLRAMGHPENPIRVLSNATRLGQAAAPGDWAQWVFSPGATGTQLEHVVFEHGRGLVVQGSAPVFNNVTVRHQQGPAISMDLAASPRGVGNKAEGNTINGIVVPAGDILGNVRWGLRGIPYIVQSGAVSVGATPTLQSVSPQEIQAGDSNTFNLTGTRLTGLTNVSFDRSGLSVQVQPGGTDTSVQLTVAADGAAAAGPATLEAWTDAGPVRLSNAISVQESRPLIKSLVPASLYTGQGNVSLTVNGLALRNDTQVLVDGVAVSTQFVSATQLSASVSAPLTPATLRVSLRSPDAANAGQFITSPAVDLPVLSAVLSVAPAASSVFNGSSTTLTVQLPYPAPSGGLDLTVVSSVPSVATAPAAVHVAEGQTSAALSINALGVGSSVVTVSRVGFASGQATVNVMSPPRLTLSPSALTLGVGRSAELSVQSSAPASASGLLVSLSSSHVAVATVPTSVTIPAGATTATVLVSTVSEGSATVTATAENHVSAQTAVNVRPLSIVLPAGSLVAPGLSRSIPLTLSDPAPAGGLEVALSSGDPAVASVPVSVVVPAGQTSINFTLTGVAAGTTSVAATAAGHQAASLPVTVEAVAIGLGSPSVSSVSIPQGMSRKYAVTLSRPAPVGGVTVSLGMSNTAVATVSPTTVTIAQGETSGGVVQVELLAVEKGSTTLTASGEGLSSRVVPVTVTDPVMLKFTQTTEVVGKGMRNYWSALSVQRVVNGTPFFSGADALVVNLSSSDPSKVGVPASVTIPAESSGVNFQVTGVDLTGDTVVTIDATAAGYSAPATKVQVQVAEPVLYSYWMRTERSVGEARDDFHVGVSGPEGGVYPAAQRMVADTPVGVAIAEANPVGLVDGIYDASTGGTAITQVVIPAGGNSSSSVYVGTPNAAGTYKISASATGMNTATSPTVTVSAPELKFGQTTEVVGKGMRNYPYALHVQRAVNGTAFTGVDALVVNLSSSDPSKASVPASVTIPAGQSTAYFQVTGVDLTGGTAVTIDATAAGHSAPATKVQVQVAEPVLSLTNVDTSRSVGEARDNFYVSVSGPAGGQYPSSQAMAANTPVSVAIAEASPAGLVNGIYSASTAGAVITQLVIPAGDSNSDWAYIATPSAAGTYKVGASATGMNTATSPTVTVSAPELKFGQTAEVVGKGMNTYLYSLAVQRAVNGTAFNGVEALTVHLACSAPSICSVPATVTIPAGQSTAYFQITGVGVGDTTVTATAVGYTTATDLSIRTVEPQLVFSGPSNTTVGGQSNFYVYLTVTGSSYPNNQSAVDPMTVTFTSSAPGVATVPATGTIAAGSNNTSTLKLTGLAAGSTSVTASGTGMLSATSGVVTVAP